MPTFLQKTQSKLSLKCSLFLLGLFFPFLSSFSQEQSSSDTIAFSMEEALKDPENIKVLDLQKQKLKELPDSFHKLTQLHTLYLDKNKLSELPPSIASCKDLKSISFSNNKFEALPDVICQLEQLRRLDFSTNEIAVLPDCLKNLIHLQYLLMVGNEVSKIPESLGDLELVELDMRMIQMNEAEQAAISKLFPNSTIKFSKACNCFSEEEEIIDPDSN
jgi:Leucine-rich repeat (LRR) protein